MNKAKKYWGYRIDIQNIKYFSDELESGRLRQGWGYETSQKLPDTADKGARGNLRIYQEVKEGDILLIPRLPNWNDITIARATKDFGTAGYKFEIDKEKGDYGHIFPVKIIKPISRYSKNLHDGLQRTLKSRGRFWQIRDCDSNIEEIINSKDNEAVTSKERFGDSLANAFKKAFDENIFHNSITENMQKNFASKTWEDALVEALKIIYPSPHFEVTREGGVKEKEHGTDILIKISGPRDIYGIAIQVKDWWDQAGEQAIYQLKKADDYWEKEKGVKLIDKILIITRANYKENEHFVQLCDDNGITPLLEEELSDLLYKVGRTVFLKQEASL